MAPRKSARSTTKASPGMSAPRKSARSSTKASSRMSAPNPIKAPKSTTDKPCKQIFKGLIFSFSGDFTKGCGEQASYENMIRWIKHHGGIYESEVNDETTHLVCTIDDYKKKTGQVKKALVLGRACVTVVPDFVMHCLMSEPVRLRSEKPYTLNRVMKRVHLAPKKQRQWRAKFKGGVKACKQFFDNDLYHIYYDKTGFEYKVICVRPNTDGEVKQEKYTIYLFESHAKPNIYKVGAKFHKGPGHPISYWNTESQAKIFQDAFADFKRFFRSKTGINWDDRCDGLPQDPNKFKYFAPTLGRPVGLLPEGKSRPAFPKDDMGDDEMADVPEGLIYATDSEAEEESQTTSATPIASPDGAEIFRSRTPISISNDSEPRSGDE